MLIAVNTLFPSHRTNVLVASYVPSDSDSNVYNNLSQLLSTFSETHCMSPLDLILCVDDFNLPHVSWIFDHECPSAFSPVNLNTISSNLIDNLLCSGLYQMDHVHNFM